MAYIFFGCLRQFYFSNRNHSIPAIPTTLLALWENMRSTWASRRSERQIIFRFRFAKIAAGWRVIPVDHSSHLIGVDLGVYRFGKRRLSFFVQVRGVDRMRFAHLRSWTKVVRFILQRQNWCSRQGVKIFACTLYLKKEQEFLYNIVSSIKLQSILNYASPCIWIY